MFASARFALVVGVAALVVPVASADPPPRFTEEREAAAIHFVKKQCPELMPLLEELKKANRASLRSADPRDVPGHRIARGTAGRPEALRTRTEDVEGGEQGARAGRETGDPEGRGPQGDRGPAAGAGEGNGRTGECSRWNTASSCLQSELASSKDELAKFRDNLERTVKDRYESLLEKARKKKP